MTNKHDDLAGLDDRELVQRVRDGDPDALNELVRRYEGVLKSRIRRLGLGGELQKLEQSTAIVDSVLKDAPKILAEDKFEFRSGEELESWLLRHVEFKIKQKAQWWGAHKRKGSKPLIGGSAAELQIAAEPGDLPTPSEVFMEKERKARLREALDLIKPEHKQAIQLRHYEQLPYRAIGNQLGLTEDAARMRVARAEAALAGVYRDRGWNQPELE